MSDSRQPGEGGVIGRSYAVTHPPDLDLPSRAFDDWDQLVHAASGVMTVHTPVGAWVVPPNRAVWIPAGTAHAVRLPGRVRLRTVYLHVDIVHGRGPDRPRVLRVHPLLRELMLDVCRLNTLRHDDPTHLALVQLLLARMSFRPDQPLQRVLPRDPRALRVARALADEPADLGAALDLAGASRRTVERLFRDQTGLTLGRWRRRAAMLCAIERLVEGDPVQLVAPEVGYRSTSAFISAFRRELGQTPGAFLADDDA